MKQEMDEWLKQKLDEDLEALLDERERILMESEELQGIDMPMEKLQDIYRAYEMYEKKKTKKRLRFRPMAAVAAVLVLCVGVGLVSNGNRVFIPEIIQQQRGDEINTKVENTDSLYSEFDEEEVCQEIEDKLGVIPVRFGYRPKGMHLIDYFIDESAKEVLSEYEYQKYKLYVYICKEYRSSSIDVQSDGIMLEEFTVDSNRINIEIHGYEDSKDQNYYVASFEYLNTYYFISGTIELEELEELLENISLKNS